MSHLLDENKVYFAVSPNHEGLTKTWSHQASAHTNCLNSLLKITLQRILWRGGWELATPRVVRFSEAAILLCGRSVSSDFFFNIPLGISELGISQRCCQWRLSVATRSAFYSVPFCCQCLTYLEESKHLSASVPWQRGRIIGMFRDSTRETS